MPVRQKFTRAQFQTAALKIVDKEGLAALSMRSLAGALGTGPMTIYNYFEDRDELEALFGRCGHDRSPNAQDGACGLAHRRAGYSARHVASRSGASQRNPADPDTPHKSRDDAGDRRSVAARAGAGRLFRGRATHSLPHLEWFRHGSCPGATGIRLPGAPSKSGRIPYREVASLPGDKFPKLHEIAYAATRSIPIRNFMQASMSF